MNSFENEKKKYHIWNVKLEELGMCLLFFLPLYYVNKFDRSSFLFLTFKEKIGRKKCLS